MQSSARKTSATSLRGPFGVDVVIGIAQFVFATLRNEATELSRDQNNAMHGTGTPWINRLYLSAMELFRKKLRCRNRQRPTTSDHHAPRIELRAVRRRMCQEMDPELGRGDGEGARGARVAYS